MKPLIAIVGRPNVGKSMLFNKLVGQRLSIVEDTPGVTRDRLYAEAEWRNRKFDLVDTGGIEPSADSQILAFMRQQAEIAIQHATVILLVSARPISPNSGQYQCRTRYCRADQRMPARLRSSARAKNRRQG